MDYVERIENLIKRINTEIVDFTQERTRGTAPTQVSSEFLTNKEQCDWAEIIKGSYRLKYLNNGAEAYVIIVIN